MTHTTLDICRRGLLAASLALPLWPALAYAQEPQPQQDQFRNSQRNREAEAARRLNSNSLTLQQCVDLALDQNLDVRRAENTLAIAQKDVTVSYGNYLPTIRGSVGFTRTFGTTFDPVQFARIERNTNSANPGLFLSLPVFQGFANLYTLKQARELREASEQALIRQRNTVLQNVVLQYLQVIFDQSNIDITRTRLELLQNQFVRQERLYRAGSAVRFDVLNVQSQIAVEEQNLITQENTLRTDKIRLLQLLQVDPLDSLDGGYNVVPIDTGIIASQIRREELPPVAVVESAAFENMPDLKESESRRLAAKYGYKIAFGSYLPTLTFNAGWQSQYSSNFTEQQRVNGLTPFAVAPNPAQPTVLDTLGYLPFSSFVDGGETPFFTQLRENQNQFIGFSLNIPILNGLTARRNYQVARIQYENAELDYQVRENALTLQVRQAYYDVLAAQQQQESLDRQAAALIEAFTVAEAQYNAGLINFVQYLEALNNRSRIEQQQFQSLYNYFLRKKVLDLYMGRPIEF